MVEVRDRLYELMSRYDLRQSDISRATGISKSLISDYLAGRKIPKQDKIFKIATTYKVDPVWLAGFDNDNLFARARAYSDLLEKMETLSSTEKQTVEDLVDYLLTKRPK